MKLALPLALLLAGLVLVLGFFIVSGRSKAKAGASAPPSPAIEPMTEGAELASPPEGAKATSPVTPATREAVTQATPEPAPSPGAVDPDQGAPDRVAHVKGRCVDDAARPLAGVSIESQGLAGEHSSAPDGSFRVEVRLGQGLRQSRSLLFSLEGHGARRLEAHLWADQTVDLGDVVLLPAGRVSGRVVDANGVGLGGALVQVEEGLDVARGTRFEGPRASVAEGAAEEDGRFLLTDVPAGPVRVWAGQEDWQWSATARLELAPGGELGDLELVLEPLAPEDTIELVVLDPTGAPVPHADVTYHYQTRGRSGSGSLQADEQGRCRKFLEVRTTYTFQATDPEDRYRPALVEGVEPGVHDLVLQLGERRTFRLRVEDTAGAPVETFLARVAYPDLNLSSSYSSEESTDLPAGQLDVPEPSAAFELSVDADGFAVSSLGPYEPGAVPREVVARLTPLPAVSGRVLSDSGPVAGARVSLMRAIDERQRLVVNGFACFERRAGGRTEETDDEGRFRVTLRESGDWYVRAEAAGYAPGELGPLTLEAGLGAQGLELFLGPGGTIEGRVIVPAGEEPSGHIIGLSRGDGSGFTGRTDAEGRYRFAGLTPGPWQVVLRQAEISTSSTTSSSSSTDTPVEIPWDCEVFEGKTTRFDLDLRALRTATVEGTFLLGGAAPRDWQVRLSSLDDPALQQESASLDAGGRFRLTTSGTGRFALDFTGELGESFVFAHAELELEPGPNDFDLDLPAGRLTGSVLPELFGDDAYLSVSSRASSRVTLSASLNPRPDGSFTVAPFPAGPAVISYRTTDGEEGNKQLDVPLGDTLDVIVP